MRASLVEQNHQVGVLVGGSDANIETCRIAATQPNGNGLFGDGLLAFSAFAVPTHVFVDATRIDDSARAGLSSFGASVSLGATAIDCAAFDLDGEPYFDANFAFDDRSGTPAAAPRRTVLVRRSAPALRRRSPSRPSSDARCRTERARAMQSRVIA